jgi:glycosyltransferase involved in cell wall biosynthesis
MAGGNAGAGCREASGLGLSAMNILLISHYTGPSKYSTTCRHFYFAREWVKLGHQVTFVAASSSHLHFAEPSINGDVTEENIEGIRHIWLKTPSYRGNGVGRLWNMLAFVGQLFRYKDSLMGDRTPDVVIATSTHLLDTIPACQIARKHHAKLIREVRDLWPLTLIELGGISPWHPLIILMQWAEHFVYRNADCVVSTLPKAEPHMRAHGLAPGKYAYIPNGIDVAEWQSNGSPMPHEHSSTLMRLKQQGCFIIGYTGAHGLTNALHTLVDAAQLLQTQPVVFVLIGQGPQKGALQEKSRQLGLTNVVFLPPVPKLCLPALLGCMDAFFIGWNRTPIYHFGISPNKLMDYMMAAKPVIHAVEAGNDPVAESGCGISTAAESAAAVADAVMRLISMGSAEHRAMGKRGKEYVLANHDYRILAQRFLQLM